MKRRQFNCNAYEFAQELNRHHREIRMWFSTFSTLCGIWQTKNGRTLAFAEVNGKVIVYKPVFW